MPAVQSLTGILKSATDIDAVPVRIRYQDSQVIKSNQYFRIVFPRHANDQMLDLRTPKLCFYYFNSVGGIDTAVDIAPDGHSMSCLFNRMRVLSGSTVLVDISNADLLNNFLEDVEVCLTSNSMDKDLIGYSTIASQRAAHNGKKIIMSIGPIGSLLNMDGILPLNRMNDLTLELWTNKAEDCLTSPTDVTGAFDFRLERVEVDCRYLKSPSLSAYFNANPIKFSVVDYSHRYESILTKQALVRFSSSHSSLDKFLVIFRDSATATGGTKVKDKFNTFTLSDLLEANVYINSHLYKEEDIDSIQECWAEARKAFPDLACSDWFDLDYKTSKFFFALNLTSAPHDFYKKIQSGVKSSSLNSDIALKLNLAAIPTAPIRVDMYLISTATVYLSQPGGDLKIQY